MQPSMLDLDRKNYLIGCFLNEQRQNVQGFESFLTCPRVGVGVCGNRGCVKNFIKAQAFICGWMCRKLSSILIYNNVKHGVIRI